MEEYHHKLFFLLSIIVVICIIQVYKTYKEYFTSSTNNIVLIGDSIFDNSKYVGNDESVEYYLSTETSIPSTVLAKDEAKMSDTLVQFNSIPTNLNNPNTTLFISMGANNILNLYSNDSTDDLAKFNLIWANYQVYINNFKQRSKCRIILTNIYYVTDPLYSKYIHLTEKWNSNLKTYAKEQNLQILDISKVLVDSSDFTNGIEPSATGGYKLVEELLTMVPNSQ